LGNVRGWLEPDPVTWEISGSSSKANIWSWNQVSLGSGDRRTCATASENALLYQGRPRLWKLNNGITRMMKAKDSTFSIR